MISIKSDREIELMKKAGHINYLTHMHLKKYLKPGITTDKLNTIADKFIRSQGGIPATLGYEGYPKSICISINDEVVHGIASQRKIKNGDIVTFDIVVSYKGYQADSAKTFIVGNVTKDVENLVINTEKSLYEGLKVIKNGVKVSAIGGAIENYAKKCGLSVIHELCGHGIGTNMHEDPDVPNYYTNDKTILKSGMTIAVEPMLALGKRKVYMEDDDWTIKTYDQKASAHFEHTVLVTDDGYEILTGE